MRCVSRDYDFAISWLIKRRASDFYKALILSMVVKRDYKEVMMILLTLHHWTAFWSVPIPSTIIQAFSIPQAMELISIVTAVVGY